MYIFYCKRHLLPITRIYSLENILLYVHQITIVSVFLFAECYKSCKICVTLNMTAAISCFLFIYFFKICLLFLSIDTCPPHITDAAWRLEYCIKVRCFFKLCQRWLLYSLSYDHCFSRQNSHLHKVNQPSYLISLNTEVCNFRYIYSYVQKLLLFFSSLWINFGYFCRGVPLLRKLILVAPWSNFRYLF